MQTRRLGLEGPEVSALGVCCAAFGRTRGDEAEERAARTIRTAMDAGLTFLDTADFYGSGQSETIVGRAIKDRRDRAFLSVKFGLKMGPDGRALGLDGRPASVRNYCAYSLRRLGVVPMPSTRSPRSRSNIRSPAMKFKMAG